MTLCDSATRAKVFVGLEADLPAAPDDMTTAYMAYDTGAIYVPDNTQPGGLTWRQASGGGGDDVTPLVLTGW